MKTNPPDNPESGKAIPIGLAIFALFAMAAAIVMGQSFVVPSGSGSSSPSAAITNLTPYSANMNRITAATITPCVTNFTRRYTNWESGLSLGSNMVVDISGTNNWIEATNSGLYDIGFEVVYSFEHTSSQHATNVWGITTNFGAPGTNFTAVMASTVGQGGTNRYTVAARGLIHSPSNAFYSLAYYGVGGLPTNNIVVHQAHVVVTRVQGSSGSSGGGVGDVTTDQLNTASNAVVAYATTATNGVVSKIWTATMSNATIKPLVVGIGTAAGATNQTGQLRGLEAGSNVSLTENGSNLVIAASVSGSGVSTNGTQFGGTADGQLSLKSGIMVTNVDALNLTNRGVSFFTGDATFSGNVTNNSRVWLNERINQVDPANAATFGQLRSQTLQVTNWVDRHNTNATANTATADWNGPGNFWYSPSGTFTLSFTNVPAAQTTPSRVFNVRVLTAQSGTFQNIGPKTIDWGADGGPVFVSGITNRFTFEDNGTNITAINWQEIITGTGATVKSNTPTMTGVILKGTTTIDSEVVGQADFRTNLNATVAVVTNGVRHMPTNGNVVLMRAANSNSVPVTNIAGVVQMAYATAMIMDANLAHRFEVTNRAASGNCTIVLTNVAPYQEMYISMYGEASGGTSRTVTISAGSPNNGASGIVDMDTFGVAAGPTKAFTLTNGNLVEISAYTSHFHVTSTRSNRTSIVTRQAAF